MDVSPTSSQSKNPDCLVFCCPSVNTLCTQHLVFGILLSPFTCFSYSRNREESLVFPTVQNKVALRNYCSNFITITKYSIFMRSHEKANNIQKMYWFQRHFHPSRGRNNPSLSSQMNFCMARPKGAHWNMVVTPRLFICGSTWNPLSWKTIVSKNSHRVFLYYIPTLPISCLWWPCLRSMSWAREVRVILPQRETHT